MSNDRRNLDRAAFPAPKEPELSSHRAFVVQFYTRAGEEQELFHGRAEHIVSGMTSWFQNQRELVAFLTRVLTEVDEKPRSPV